MKYFITCLILLTILGCSSAGPFVTNISSDGQGGLIIEKCSVQYNKFTNSVSTKECTTTTIKLFDKKP